MFNYVWKKRQEEFKIILFWWIVRAKRVQDFASCCGKAVQKIMNIISTQCQRPGDMGNVKLSSVSFLIFQLSFTLEAFGRLTLAVQEILFNNISVLEKWGRNYPQWNSFKSFWLPTFEVELTPCYVFTILKQNKFFRATYNL